MRGGGLEERERDCKREIQGGNERGRVGEREGEEREGRIMTGEI